jgi:hypothetical protein
MILWIAELKEWELFSAPATPAVTLLKYTNPAVTDTARPVKERRLMIGFLND